MGSLDAHRPDARRDQPLQVGGEAGWAAIFGRILVGFLNEHQATFGAYDLITPSPTYLGAGSTRSFDHTRRIVEAAEIEEPIAWPFAYDLIAKTASTEPMVGHSWRERKTIAEGPLRAALDVQDPEAISNTRIPRRRRCFHRRLHDPRGRTRVRPRRRSGSVRDRPCARAMEGRVVSSSYSGSGGAPSRSEAPAPGASYRGPSRVLRSGCWASARAVWDRLSWMETAVR